MMTIFTVLKYSGLIILALIGLFFAFMYLSYLNETVTEGEGYGFRIGMTKAEAFKAAKKEYQREDLFVAYSGNEIGSISSIEKMNFSDRDFARLLDYDFWSFFYGRNSIDLSFENDALIEIHRHRQYFELP